MEAVQRLLSGLDWEGIAERLDLSPRQAVILRGILEEKKVAAIAAGLGLKPRTVETHIERLFRKGGVHTRLGLAVLIFSIAIQLERERIAGEVRVANFS